jgi:hypothetical protein
MQRTISIKTRSKNNETLQRSTSTKRRDLSSDQMKHKTMTRSRSGLLIQTKAEQSNVKVNS